MSNSWTVGKKLFTVFGALGALVVVLGAVAWWATGTLKSALDTATKSTARKLELALVIDGNVRGLRSEQRRSLLGLKPGEKGAVSTSIKEGGVQIEYRDQDPRIHEIWLKAIKANGVTSDMGDVIDESPWRGKI